MRCGEYGDAALGVATSSVGADVETGGAGDRDVDLVENRVGCDRVGRAMRAWRRIVRLANYMNITAAGF